MNSNQKLKMGLERLEKNLQGGFLVERRNKKQLEKTGIAIADSIDQFESGNCEEMDSMFIDFCFCVVAWSCHDVDVV